MNWIENLLIIAGISLDIFASMECHGSLVAKIEKKQLLFLGLLVSLWQLAALYIGSFLSGLLVQKDGIAANEQLIGGVLAAAIFIGLGIRLVAKAIKNERIQEHRQDGIVIRKVCYMLATAGIYTVLAGVAFGFVESELVFDLIAIVCCSLLAVIAGIYTGYHFGFEQKRKAYAAGAALLFFAGADIIVRHIIF